MSDARSNMQRLREARRHPAEAVDTRRTILEAFERRLATQPLAELSVADILTEAGVSRPTYYSYFSSKFEAAAALLDTAMEEMDLVLSPAVGSVVELPSFELLQGVLIECSRIWERRAAIFRAVHEHWHTVPELGGRWTAAVERFAALIAGELDREAAKGLIPTLPDYHRRAAVVLWSTENMLYVAGSNDPSGAFADREALMDLLMDLWAGVLYPGGDVGPRPNHAKENRHAL